MAWPTKHNPSLITKKAAAVLIKNNLLLILLCPCLAFSQLPPSVANTYFSKAQLTEDLTYMNKYLKKWHPTYYSYTPKDKMNRFYDSLIGALPDSLNSFEFRKYLRSAAAMVKCGHMAVTGSKAYTTELKNIKQKFFPLQVRILGGDVFVVGSYDSTLTGFTGKKLLSINGTAAPQILSDLRAITFTDALNQTHLDRTIERSFGAYYAIRYGFADSFPTEVQGVGLVEIPSAIIKNEVRTGVRVSIDTLFKTKRSYLTRLAPDLHLMKLSNFSDKGLKKFYRQSFRYLKAKQAQNLVIDLRGNGGGNVFKGNKLLCYFLPQPLVPLTIRRKPNLTIFHPKAKAEFWVKITPLLLSFNPIQYPGRYGWYKTFFSVKKFNLQYRNQVFVLTDGDTFSMASYVAAHLKHKANAITVGQETGGSEFGSRAMASCDIVVPNTKSRIILNLYQLNHATKMPDSSHGVLPNHRIDYTIDDVLNRKDLELEKVIQLVK